MRILSIISFKNFPNYSLTILMCIAYYSKIVLNYFQEDTVVLEIQVLE